MTATLRANGLPTVPAVCAMLGVPRADWSLFDRWAADLHDEKNLDALHAYVDVMVAERCWRPRHDLLSRLIAAGVGGEELTSDELRAVAVALLTKTSKFEGTTPRT